MTDRIAEIRERAKVTLDEMRRACKKATPTITMRIPAEPDRDLDLLIDKLCDTDIPYLLAQLDAARAEVERVKSERDSAVADIAHAIKNAKSYEPDYPWSQNTASEAVWALGEGLRGMEQACDEWRIKAEARRHLLPIVTAGEAVDDDIGLAWNGHDWRPARKERDRFVGLVAEIVGVTHWLPAARVPGPEGAK